MERADRVDPAAAFTFGIRSAAGGAGPEDRAPVASHLWAFARVEFKSGGAWFVDLDKAGLVMLEFTIKSRRPLDPAQARSMVAVREARRAFRDNKTQCFWSFDPEWNIQSEQVPLVIRTLRNEGNAQAFAVAKRLHKLHAKEKA